MLWCPVYTTCMSGACGNQKRASDPLEIKLQMLLSQHVCAEN